MEGAAWQVAGQHPCHLQLGVLSDCRRPAVWESAIGHGPWGSPGLQQGAGSWPHPVPIKRASAVVCAGACHGIYLYLCGNATGLTHPHVSVTAILETVPPPPAAPGRSLSTSGWLPRARCRGLWVSMATDSAPELQSRKQWSLCWPWGGLPWVYHCGLVGGDQKGALNVPDS